MEVVAVEARSGGFVRVTFRAEFPPTFTWPGPASHLKFFPPDHRADGDVDPAGRRISRTYTPRSFDATTRKLVIDFFGHGDGPATSWAREARPGALAGISQPRTTWSPEPDATWILLAGDDSAVPAISTIVEAGLTGTTTVIVETSSSDLDRPEMPAGARISWVPTDSKRPGHALLGAVSEYAQPRGLGAVWVAGEALAIRQIRRHLIDDRSFSPELIVTRGYWRQGEVNHPDHDFGIDEPK